jgi:excisionase family DNA binding protein
MKQRDRKNPSKENVLRATLTVDEAAQTIGIGRVSTYAAIRCGQIPSVRFGKRLLVPRAALEKLLSVEGRAKISAS